MRSQPEAASAVKTAPPRTKSSFIPDTPAKLGEYDANGNWIGPGPEPKKGRRRHRKSSGPKEATHSHKGGARKEILAHMKHNLEIMKENYKDTENIFKAHSAWPLYPIYEKIENCIKKCKEAIHEARSYTGPQKHKHNVEAVHAKRIDTSGWGFKAIHDAITKYVYQAERNHLKLERPHHHADGTHMYVNVVLAWLFAAKRQMMTNLTVYIAQAFNPTPAMGKFLEHEHKGREAFAAYHKYKRELPVRKHKPYHLEDQALLAEQYAALYE